MMAFIQTMSGGDGVMVTIICTLLGFISFCMKGLVTAYKNNQKFVSELIEKDTLARERMADKHTEAWDKLSQKNAENSDRLAQAIDHLSAELKSHNNAFSEMRGLLRGQADQLRRLD